MSNPAAIGERFTREPEFNISYGDVTCDYGFTAPWWGELMDRLSRASVPFIVGGQAPSQGEPTVICVSPRGTTNHNRTRSDMNLPK